MNKTVGLIILILLTGMLCPGVRTPRSHGDQILSIDIYYRNDAWGTTENRYKIIFSDGAYYVRGKKIDSEFIYGLQDSLTDFYEASQYEEEYEGFYTIDDYPHFLVVILFEHDTPIALRSTATYHCHIPWNIEHEGKRYVQYNGKIPTALFKILVEIDPEGWDCCGKLARCGCYAARVPQKYSTLSKDFPISPVLETPEEKEGRKHILWEFDVDDSIIGNPVYAERRLFVMTQHKVISFDVKTKKKVWEVTLGESDLFYPFMHHENRLCVAVGRVYAGGPDAVVYCIDSETGGVEWIYKTGTGYVNVEVALGNVLVEGHGVAYLDGKTGKEIWGREDAYDVEAYGDEIYGDIIICRMGEDGEDYYALIDIKTGEIIWKGDYLFDPTYEKDVIYTVNFQENVLAAISVSTNKELWTYHYDVSCSYKVFPCGIALVEEDAPPNIHSLVLLSKSGSEVWRCHLPEGTPEGWTDINLAGSHLLLTVEGVILAFNVHNGKFLWQTEIKGNEIDTFEFSKGRVYLSANDATFYCLRMDTGKPQWKIVTQKEFIFFPREWKSIFTSRSEDSLIVIATEEGHIYVLSVYPL